MSDGSGEEEPGESQLVDARRLPKLRAGWLDRALDDTWRDRATAAIGLPWAGAWLVVGLGFSFSGDHPWPANESIRLVMVLAPLLLGLGGGWGLMMVADKRIVSARDALRFARVPYILLPVLLTTYVLLRHALS